MIRLIGAFLILQVLSGCATAPQQHWYNSRLDNQVINSRFVIDRGQCQAMALQSVPAPRAAPSYNPAGSTSQVELTSSNGQFYYGQITTQPTGAPENLLQAVQRQQYNNQINQTKENLYNSCMYQRGWELR